MSIQVGAVKVKEKEGVADVVHLGERRKKGSGFSYEEEKRKQIGEEQRKRWM